MVPLSEDCGFIEWVPDTVTLRSACTATYEAANLFDRRLTLAAVKKLYDNFSVRAFSEHARNHFAMTCACIVPYSFSTVAARLLLTRLAQLDRLRLHLSQNSIQQPPPTSEALYDLLYRCGLCLFCRTPLPAAATFKAYVPVLGSQMSIYWYPWSLCPCKQQRAPHAYRVAHQQPFAEAAGCARMSVLSELPHKGLWTYSPPGKCAPKPTGAQQG